MRKSFPRLKRGSAPRVEPEDLQILERSPHSRSVGSIFSAHPRKLFPDDASDQTNLFYHAITYGVSPVNFHLERDALAGSLHDGLSKLSASNDIQIFVVKIDARQVHEARIWIIRSFSRRESSVGGI